MKWNKIINDKIFHSRESLVKVRNQWKHRQEKVVFIEVQTGTYFGEDDIVRIEDDYNRA